MKKIKDGLLLVGLLSALLAIVTFYVVGVHNGMYLLTIPFDLIGNGLRFLSLSSKSLNVLAFILYSLFSLLPTFYMLYKSKRSFLERIDLMLAVLSIYSFYMMYQFINPGLLVSRMPELLADSSAIPLIKLILVIVYYSLLIGYIVLRFTGTLFTRNITDRMNYLCNGLKQILVLVSIVYTFMFGYFYTFKLLNSLNKYMIVEPSSISVIVVLVKYVLEGLPVLFTILIFMYGVMLLNAMISNHLKDEEILAAEQLGIISRNAVYITVFSNITLNILQFILNNKLIDTEFSVEISIFPLIIAFSAMILSGYFKHSKELYEDSEMII